MTLSNVPSLHSTADSENIRWVWHVARMGERRNTYRILLRKPEGRRPLGRSRRRWVDNIRMDLREIVRVGNEIRTELLQNINQSRDRLC
jgi:hypothetical protein